jgi:hypothetical protein
MLLLKQLSLIVLFVLSACVCYSQPLPKDCAVFKTGKFTYKDDSSRTVIVTRTNKRQVEVTKELGITTKLKVKWVDDCSYELKQLWSSDKAKRKHPGGPTVVIITKTNSDGYDYTCVCRDTTLQNKNSGTMLKLK